VRHSFINGGDKKLAVGLRFLNPIPLTNIVEKDTTDISSKIIFRKNDYERLQSKIKTDKWNSSGMSGGDSSEEEDDDCNPEREGGRRRGGGGGGEAQQQQQSSFFRNEEELNAEKKKCKMDRYVIEQSCIVGAYFPLIATIMPVWNDKIKAKHATKPTVSSSSSSSSATTAPQPSNHQPQSTIFTATAPSKFKDETPSIRKIIFLVHMCSPSSLIYLRADMFFHLFLFKKKN
jgi:hypothetical protein